MLPEILYRFVLRSKFHRKRQWGRCKVEIEPQPTNTPHCDRRHVELPRDHSQESSALLAPLNILDKSRFGEGVDVVSDDEVVEDANVDEGQGVAQAAGDLFVGWAGGRRA